MTHEIIIIAVYICGSLICVLQQRDVIYARVYLVRTPSWNMKTVMKTESNGSTKS